jgi:hypothetical protein
LARTPALQALIMHIGPLPATTDLKCSDALEAILLDKKVAGGSWRH